MGQPGCIYNKFIAPKVKTHEVNDINKNKLRKIPKMKSVNWFLFRFF